MAKTILLVDDDAQVREVTMALLEAKGYQTLQAESLQQALEVWTRNAERIDLVMTDLVMPGGTGEVLARQLRAQQPSVKILFTSGYSEEFLGENPEATHRWFLCKPWAPDDLFRTVEECLEG